MANVACKIVAEGTVRLRRWSLSIIMDCQKKLKKTLSSLKGKTNHILICYCYFLSSVIFTGIIHVFFSLIFTYTTHVIQRLRVIVVLNQIVSCERNLNSKIYKQVNNIFLSKQHNCDLFPLKDQIMKAGRFPISKYHWGFLNSCGWFFGILWVMDKFVENANSPTYAKVGVGLPNSQLWSYSLGHSHPFTSVGYKH